MPDDFAEEIKKAVQKEPILAAASQKTAHSPPVFVKVERYKELLEDVRKLRSYSLGMRDALDAMAEIEKEMKTAMELSHKVLDKLNIIISSLDMKLLKTTGRTGVSKDGALSASPPQEIESYVKGIYEQIEKLKGELHTLSSAT